METIIIQSTTGKREAKPRHTHKRPNPVILTLGIILGFIEAVVIGAIKRVTYVDMQRMLGVLSIVAAVSRYFSGYEEPFAQSLLLIVGLILTFSKKFLLD